jgi:uncharacterized membrane protein
MIDWLEFRWLLFLAALLMGAGVLYLGGMGWRLSLVVAFDLVATAYLVGTIYVMARGDIDTIRRHARVIDAGRWSLLAVSVVLSTTVLAALGVEIEAAEAVSVMHLLLAAASIFVSWVFMNTVFSMHYAHTFYEVNRAAPGGLAFPQSAAPDYLDFLYFAFVIGMTFQTSDVAIVDREIRRVVLLHSVVAFFFNVIVISIAVSTLGTIMGQPG